MEKIIEKKNVNVVSLESKVKMSEEEKQISAHINLYYLTVDSKDIDFYRNLYALYWENIEYNRCNLDIKGKEDFIKFFEDRFNNLDIRHKIEAIIPLDNKVYVKWSFSWKNIRLNKNISWDFVDIHTFSNEKNPKDRKIIERRTYLSNEVLKHFCALEKDDIDITYEYTKHKFMKMWYGIEVIKWTNSEGNEVNTIRFMNLQNWKDMYFDSSVWSEIIK